MVNQTATNLLHIQSLGVRKIVVGGLQPLGCLPGATATTSFQQCNSTLNQRPRSSPQQPIEPSRDLVEPTNQG